MSGPDAADFPAISNRRRFCALLLASGAAAVLAQDADARKRLPPWRQPVASTYRISAGDAVIQVDMSPGHPAVGVSSLLAWVERAVQTITVYYGKFPVSRYRVRVDIVPRANKVLGGTTWGDVAGVPAFTNVAVGEAVTDGELISDEVITREMVQTAFSAQPGAHAWIEEGLAAYVAPVARVQAGFSRPETAWAAMVRNLPQGDPQAGDKGLDRARVWERVFWGGAQFCLLADVTIRGQTRNRVGLQDALRRIVSEGGTISAHWPLKKAFETGDRATGTRVLMTQYLQMRDSPARVDLDGLWRELGVELIPGDGVRFNDAAPLASSRRAIMAVDKRKGNALGIQPTHGCGYHSLANCVPSILKL